MRTAHPPRKKRKQSNKDNLASKCCACSCQDSCGNRNKKKTKEKEASLLNILKLREFENIDIRSRIEKRCLRNMNIIRDNEGKFIFSDAIYNLEFSTDDKIVLSGGANEEVSIYDSCFCSLKKVGSFKTGHEPGVNGIKFLDSRLILTCSDDKQIALWDIRNTAERVSTLQGHESWVKSMSFNNETKTLISSAFDDTIRLWNIDKYQQDGSIKSDVILKIPFLVRTEFSKDFTKLVVSTTTGLLLFFDNIDLDNLSRYDDTMKLLEPRQIEKGKLQIKMTKSNDLTIVEKFPEKSRPYCIGSTILSSNSNCVFSRYNTRNTGEWSVLHSFDGSTVCRPTNQLLRFMEEPDVAKEYIKEPSFSYDGRVVSSPFGNAVRLFAFNENLDQMNNKEKNTSKFYEVGFMTGHKRPVLCTKFAHSKIFLASGCLAGNVSFYQPKL